MSITSSTQVWACKTTIANPTLSPKRNGLGQAMDTQVQLCKANETKDNINFEVRPWLHNSSSNMLAVSYYEEFAMSTWQDLQNMENIPCQHEMTRKAFLNHPWNYLYKIGNLEARFYRDEVGRPVFTIEWYLDCAHPVWGKNISKSETKLEALQTQFSILYYTGSFS